MCRVGDGKIKICVTLGLRISTLYAHTIKNTLYILEDQNLCETLEGGGMVFPQKPLRDTWEAFPEVC